MQNSLFKGHCYHFIPFVIEPFLRSLVPRERILISFRLVRSQEKLRFFVKMWNSLQDELRTAPTIKHFVSQIRKITFDTCSFYAVHRSKLNLLAFDLY